GTLFGIKRARGFLRNDSWVLRLDIKGFFMAIDREILFGLVMGGLRGTHCELLEFLIRKIVFNDPLKNARFKSPRAAWNNLPPDKSLINSSPNCGLPIGNLTSQVFANVYLNPLDHFVKRKGAELLGIDEAFVKISFAHSCPVSQSI
ncbi:MAG: RNA-directed DNA polymerase, partial [Fibromonadaceae bacterium]|nr:RNA-directed DNA polymerase [Fibromonadaceae bacterium]